ncbi:transposase [Desulfitobacterium chlororespirans]|uniref:Transposase n=1 Tax=Desulfitobacterium chlororespirans DSM 11544 TaxID=1121395 RepID=A0A1M7U8W4_9FIRM|nr:transposase [Desulfitobacterium chlororespirans]SHN79512.1 Transposase [Desulfitobacterium chlororespirans DSM 11544]
MKACKSSICALRKKIPDTMDKSQVEKICVDDFALKKRYFHDSIMVNLETHKIVDIIPSRDAHNVKQWLDTFPNIKVIFRDGDLTYASAATVAHSSAIQISDRFRLLKNLAEAVGRYIIRTFPSRVEMPSVHGDYTRNAGSL